MSARLAATLGRFRTSAEDPTHSRIDVHYHIYPPQIFERILFGSDRPFAPSAPQASALAEVIKDKGLLRAIERDNALALMPGLGT